MFSIVCVYNNKKILDEKLLNSIKKQSSKYEIILLNNTANKFSSAAAALNYGATQINNDSKYIMFVHQDVVLDANTWLGDAECILNSISNLGIAGVAGMSCERGVNGKRGRNVIQHGDPPEIWSLGNRIDAPEVVQTLDECLLIVPRDFFINNKFDEVICDGWHLYGVDYSLGIAHMGYYSYVIPMSIYHHSMGIRKSNRVIRLLKGNHPDGYYRILYKIIKKYRLMYKKIYTTCGEWDTHIPLLLQRSWIAIEKAKKYLLNG